jgi:hypothetical protein
LIIDKRMQRREIARLRKIEARSFAGCPIAGSRGDDCAVLQAPSMKPRISGSAVILLIAILDVGRCRAAGGVVIDVVASSVLAAIIHAIRSIG